MVTAFLAHPKYTVLHYSILFFFYVSSIVAQSDITGRWKTFDEDTGEAISIIEIQKQGDQFYGAVATIIKEEDKNKPCIYCTGDLYNKPIQGLVILKQLQKHGNIYEDGTILDPQNGKVYRCKVWIDAEDPNTLHVRGYIAFLYRTQQWIRTE